ncbi:MAG: hypothetical protein J4G14_03640 [Dehalococcoidia bacterium]|nr:hypothetical protein [Dehalococcoidia bacterium]
MNELRLGLAGLGHGNTVLGANASEVPINVTAICDTDEGRLESVSLRPLTSTSSFRCRM